MDIRQFEEWLSAYGTCWEEGDSKGITDLFAENAHYYETPFSEPMVGLAAIEKYWSEGAEQAQECVRFEFSSVLTAGAIGVSHWRASFIRVPSGVKVELDGYLEAEFDRHGRCVNFREWWHRQESDA